MLMAHYSWISIKEELPSMTYQAHDILQQISQNQDALVFSNTDVQPKKLRSLLVC